MFFSIQGHPTHNFCAQPRLTESQCGRGTQLGLPVRSAAGTDGRGSCEPHVASFHTSLLEWRRTEHGQIPGTGCPYKMLSLLSLIL